MSNYALSQVRNFRRCNAGVPLELEIDAVIEAVTDGWSVDDVCAVAARGVDEADQTAIREVIAAEELRIEPETAAKELYDWSRNRVLDWIEEAESEDRLEELVRTYLQALGEEEAARGEMYEETAERLGDDIMRAASERWWALLEEALIEIEKSGRPVWEDRKND